MRKDMRVSGGPVDTPAGALPGRGAGPDRRLVARLYLLGQVDYEAMLALQRRLVHEVAAGAAPTLLLCEHPLGVSVGRQGSRSHFELDDSVPSGRRWPVRWVNRGGGCWLHLPGQLAVYAVLPLNHLHLSLPEYLHAWQRILQATAADFGVRAAFRPGEPAVWVGEQPLACVGIAVRDWVSSYGAILNVNPDLHEFRKLRTGLRHATMTSLERARHGPVRSALVRGQLLEHFKAQFGFPESALFASHPFLDRKGNPHAIAASR
jgi:lipoyl(octanoyl) transferase